MIKILFSSIFTIACYSNVFSQKSPEHDISNQEEIKLAEAVQNPVGDLISLPLQNNTSFGIGPFDRTQNVLNIQPVIPIRLNSKWNLITRTIAPVITQPFLLSSTVSTTGLGDINITGFLSPRAPGKFIWGIGPAIVIPTATSESLGRGKWSVGPSAVGLIIRGPWVAGLLVSNVWSFAGKSDRKDVNFFLAQYFVNYNMSEGWYLVSAPIITSNWEADSGNQWLVPFGAGAGKIFRIGKQPMNMNMQAFYNVVKPNLGPDWSLRFQLQFMFPK